jgi:hypothetical protein
MILGGLMAVTLTVGAAVLFLGLPLAVVFWVIKLAALTL